MKNYEDIAERVFRKGDAILEKKHRRTAVIKRTSFVVSGLCAVIITGFGLWNNYPLRNAMNNDYPAVTDSRNDSENDIPVMTQTSASLSGQRSNTLSMTVSAAENTDSFFSATRVSENVFPDCNSNVTTTSDKFFPVSTSTNPEDLQEIMQTSANTTAQTSENTTIQTSLSTTTLTCIVTETTSPSTNIDDERSLYMKKFTSFISALTLAASAAPVIGNAVYQIDTSRYWNGEQAIFDKMENGEFDTDINGNGEFDIMDCYTFERYLKHSDSFAQYTDSGIDSETISRINAIADYDGDGKITYNDEAHLIRYFIVSGKVTREYLEPSYYEPDTDTSHFEYNYFTSKPEYSFTKKLWDNVNYLLAGYDIIAEMCDNGTIDVDFNGDGQLDVSDIFDIHAYSNSVNLFYNDPLAQNEGYPGTETARTLISEEEWNRCNDAYQYYPCTFIPGHYKVDMFSYYVTVYITAHMELKPEYFTKEYYQETISGYVPAYGLQICVRDAAVALGLKEDEYAWTKFYSDEFNPFFDAYCKDIENGLRPAPDINLDGVVDYRDYFDANIYFADLLNARSADESILPEETWNNLAENCDFNGNGTSSDIYDITAVQLYTVRYIEEPENFDEAYNAYKESLAETSENVFEALGYEDSIKILLALDTERSGDANEDSSVTISDAVLIMQSLSNPDEYKLTTKGQFNADVCDTGDGITPSDALQIQIMLLEINSGESINA